MTKHHSGSLACGKEICCFARGEMCVRIYSQYVNGRTFALTLLVMSVQIDTVICKGSHMVAIPFLNMRERQTPKFNTNTTFIHFGLFLGSG